MRIFASFGSILFSYDSGYINSVLGMVSFGVLSEIGTCTDAHFKAYVKQTMGHPVPISNEERTGYALSTSQRSLIVSILSAGTLFGALIGGQAAEWVGRRLTTMISCLIFAIGVAVQAVAFNVSTLAVARLFAGLGVGGVSTVVILYVSRDIAKASSWTPCLGLPMSYYDRLARCCLRQPRDS